jgi:hypothetical protein
MSCEYELNGVGMKMAFNRVAKRRKLIYSGLKEILIKYDFGMKSNMEWNM